MFITANRPDLFPRSVHASEQTAPSSTTLSLCVFILHTLLVQLVGLRLAQLLLLALVA